MAEKTRGAWEQPRIRFRIVSDPVEQNFLNELSRVVNDNEWEVVSFAAYPGSFCALLKQQDDTND